MTFQAVIFDLFFTLVDPLHGVASDATEYAVLGMERADFERLNQKDYEIRGCGGIQEPYQMMAHILRGLDIPEDLIRRAANARVERIRQAIYGVDPKNIAVLRRLRKAGYKIALISNADIADVYHWADSPLSAYFDETIFSYDVKLLKPDERIYRLGAKRLGVNPEACLFVGDGGHEELRGAMKAGMTTALTTEYIPWTEKIETLKIEADYVIEKLEKIEAILQKRQKTPKTEEKSSLDGLLKSTAPIETLNISLRALNTLNRAGITTVGMIMSADKQTLKSIRHLGSKSIAEILFYQRRFIQSLKADDSSDQNSFYRRILQNLSLNDPITILNLSVRSTNALNHAGINTIKKMLDTNVQSLYNISNLGKKSVEEILDWKERIADFLLYKDEHTLVSAGEIQERIQKLTGEFHRIPSERLNKPIYDYLNAYYGVGSKNIIARSQEILDTIKTIDELPSVFDQISRTNQGTNDFLVILGVLATDLRSIVKNMLQCIYTIPKNKRFLDILQQRHTGMTLQKIADQTGLTRERIRQLQTKGIDSFIKQLCSMTIDIFAFINAEKSGAYILTTDEALDYFSAIEHVEILLFVAQIEGISDFFKYDKHFDVFFHTGKIQNLDSIIENVAKLPYIIEKDQRYAILLKISDALQLPIKLVMIEFDYIYTLFSKVYHRGALILEQVYDYILEVYYPKGIKLYDDTTISQFRKKVIDVCGDIELPKHNRAIDARLANVAVLCDRGSYIHPSHIRIDQRLIEEISAFIKDSPREVFSINEIFEIFKSKLLIQSNIHNRYFLQGMLKHYLSSQFFFTRYTISKKEGTNLIEEIEEFIRMKGEVHKSEIFEEYAGITDIMISIRVNNSRNLINIGKGWYIHANRLHIEKKDYRIRNVIEKYTKDIPISSRKVLELLWLSHPDFLSRNSITNHEKLFSILRYMFDGEFIFSRPYIARLGTKEFSCVDVIKQHLKVYHSITIPELVELCTAQQLYFSSIRTLVRDMKDIFLRVDAKTLVQFEKELDEDTVVAIAHNIMDRMDSAGYVAASKVTDYTGYPDIGFTWNVFLLRGIVEKYLNGTIDIIDIYSTDTYTMNSIFVDPLLELENHEALIRKVLKIEHTKKPFKTSADIIGWLQKQGLLLVNPPRFLLDNSVIKVDKYGNITIAD
ncbi:MAG: HAD-IA family hydrolase [Treponema sp.]|jgi:putative hydrolase of the HAD superfamily|nr:HAD-IA family hydrolase [Treponema sp.]